jgi:hypothetical protein
VVPDRDFFACPESEIADTTALLTMVGGQVVYAAGPFQAHDDGAPPPAMPDWSPVRSFGGYGGWGDGKSSKEGKPMQAAMRRMAADCACAHDCNVHGHQHATAWSTPTAHRRHQELLGRPRLRLLGGLRMAAIRRLFTARALYCPSKPSVNANANAVRLR